MYRFINDMKKYYKYAVYSAKSGLKSEVASSHLSWLWWILDPLLFMLVYVFISVIVFGSSEKYFPVFVFIGLTIWNFFSKSISGSVKIVTNNSAIVSKVYIPKFILVLVSMFEYGFKMIISFAIVGIMMLVYGVPLSFHVLFFIPIIITLFLITFGISVIVCHFGVFVEDLKNVITVVLKLVFYLSGIFYSLLGRVPEPYNELLLKLNPSAFLINECRKILLYSKMPDYKLLILWFVFGIIISAIGLRTIYKYENSYVKVI